MKQAALILLVLSGSLVMSGCLADKPPSSEGEYGLGLAIPDPLPGRAPLADDPAEVAKLEDFLRAETPRLFEECGHADEAAAERSDRFVERGNLLWAIYVLPQDCSNALVGEPEGGLARAAIANGTEEETYAHLERLAIEAIANSTRLLSTVVPGTPLDAQVHGMLASNIQFGSSSLRAARHRFGFYQDGSARDEFQLTGAYGALLVPMFMAPLDRIIERYPWTPGTCDVPTNDVLAERAEASYARTLARARQVAPARDAELSPTMYGNLVKTTREFLDRAIANDWWSSTFSIVWRLEYDWAYWDNYTVWPKPDGEKARYLLAQYRNHTHTLYTEMRLNRLDVEIEDLDQGGSYNADFMGTLVQALGALQSPFIDLECRASTDGQALAEGAPDVPLGSRFLAAHVN